MLCQFPVEVCRPVSSIVIIVVIGDVRDKVQGEFLRRYIAVFAIEPKPQVSVRTVPCMPAVHIVANEGCPRRQAHVLTFLFLHGKIVRQLPCLFCILQQSIYLYLLSRNVS